jgi:hypothetical protein
MVELIRRAIAMVVCSGAVALLVTATAGAAPALAAAGMPNLTNQAQIGVGAKLSQLAVQDNAPGGMGDPGDIWGRVTNLTPYTFTLEAQSHSPASQLQWQENGGQTKIPQTVQPGQDFVYDLRGNPVDAPFLGARRANFSMGWMTYAADTVNGQELLTIQFDGTWAVNIFNVWLQAPVITVYNSDRIPQSEASFPLPPGAHQEIGWTQSDGVGSDIQFATRGSFSLDGSKDPPQLTGMLNSMCAGAAGTSCTFTATGPLTWGVGTPVQKAEAVNCTVAGAKTGQRRVTAADPPDPPPASDPGWHRFSIEVGRTASLSAGGAITASTELNLLDVIATEVSVKFGAEHEWSNTKDFEKTTVIYLPSNYIGGIWVAPVVGKVAGTLVVSTRLATYTITNFGAVRSGANRDLQTPAFNVLTDARPMTATEYQDNCVKKQGALG